MPSMYKVKKGQKFGYWVVVDPTRVQTSQYSQWYVLCRCKCGIEKLVDIGRLHRSESKMCKTCAPKFYRQNLGKGHTAIGNLSGAYLYYIKKNARTRGLDFDLTPTFLWDLYLHQQGKCALSGMNIKLSRNMKTGMRKNQPDFAAITASLDRTDNSKGYTQDNVQWVHKVVNIVKNELTVDQLYFICKSIYTTLLRKYGNNEPSLSVEDIYILRKVQRLIGEESSSNKPDTSAALPDVNQVDDIVQTAWKHAEIRNKESE